MKYCEYKVSRDLAWKILLQERITELPVSITGICKNMGIKVKYYVPKDDNSGLSVIIGGQPVIFVNKNDSVERQRFTVAHELGHIILGHVGKYRLVNREPSGSDNPIEQAANVFASRLLAPACVLWGCGVKTAGDISYLCRISMPAAEYRMERLKVLYDRSKFLTSSLELKVYLNFERYIKENKL